MPGICRQDQDSAGGQLIAGSPNVFVNNHATVRVGDAVSGHGPDEHSGPVMAQGLSSVRINGLAVCREGDAASCGDLASGSENVRAG